MVLGVPIFKHIRLLYNALNFANFISAIDIDDGQRLWWLIKSSVPFVFIVTGRAA